MLYEGILILILFPKFACSHGTETPYSTGKIPAGNMERPVVLH